MNSRVTKRTGLILTVIFVIGASIPAFVAEGNNIVTLNAYVNDKVGTGKTQKARGVSFTKTYVYK